MRGRYEHLTHELAQLNGAAHRYHVLDHDVDHLRGLLRDDDPRYTDAGVTAAVVRLAVEHRNACTTSFCLTCTQIKHALTVAVAASRELVDEENELLLVPAGERRPRLIRRPGV